ncbi:hypothetical protein GCM10010442_29040 [Kitasatospora kifunensis]
MVLAVVPGRAQPAATVAAVAAPAASRVRRDRASIITPVRAGLMGSGPVGGQRCAAVRADGGPNDDAVPGW